MGGCPEDLAAKLNIGHGFGGQVARRRRENFRFEASKFMENTVSEGFSGLKSPNFLPAGASNQYPSNPRLVEYRTLAISLRPRPVVRSVHLLTLTLRIDRL